MPYAELHAISNFTFLRGASHPEELVAQAAQLGYGALAITDECSLAGVVRAHLAAREHQLKLIIGSEITLQSGEKLVILARNREGYAQLVTLISRGRRRASKGHYNVFLEDLKTGLPDCLILWLAQRHFPSEARESGQQLAPLFPGRLWITAQRHLESGEAAKLSWLKELARELQLPIVASGDVHMHHPSRRPLQDTLTAIRLNTSLAHAVDSLSPNGERHLRPLPVLQSLYPPEWLNASVTIAERCTFSLDELHYNYPEEAIPAGETATSYLRQLVEDGVRQHWPNGPPDKVRQLLEHELTIIAELGYEPFFITVYDLVRFARRRNILCQGRGSAANSAVCFCLGITAVDPGRMEMLFERFISKERNEPPDIDVDFEHQRREEVLQYLYQRYGRRHAALAATVITYRTKSAVRDVGRALGLPPQQLDQLSGCFSRWERGIELANRVQEAGFDPDSPLLQRLFELVEQLRGMPRHLSQHVGGMVLTREPLERLVPVENANMATGEAGALGHDDGGLEVARTIIQWDKDDIDAMHLLKVDCLGLGMLSAIHRCFDLIEGVRGRSLSLATVPKEDDETYRMISRADTIGVFQIESRAQMAMLPRLRPRCFYDLVIEIAIIRPGPIQGDMVHPYLKRRQGIEPVSYPGPEAEAVLKRTLGVPIFQEQVVKLAMVAAGFTAGEADQLRRAIAAWKKGRGLAAFEQKLRSGMAEKGYPPAFAEQLINQIKGFGEYGFPESHAASFALLAYVSSWLKCHEPAAYTCALLNSQPMGFYAPAQLIRDAREHGVTILPVNVVYSDWDCSLHHDNSQQGEQQQPSLRLGLRLIKGLSREAAERLTAARAKQPFHSVADLVQRAELDKRSRDALTDANALESLAGHRHQAHWAALGSERSLPLFPELAFDESIPSLPPPTEGESILADYRRVGLTLGRHPLALLRPQLQKSGYGCIERAAQWGNGRFIRIAGLVTARQRPGDGRTAFITLEDESGVGNIIVWEKLVQQYRKAIIGGRLIGVAGTVQSESGVTHIVAKKLEDLTPLLGELPTQSRDFH